MLYQAYQTQSDMMSALRMLAQQASAAFWLSRTEGLPLRRVSAALDVFSRLRLTHSRPAYAIDSIPMNERAVPVTEERPLALPFGTLLRFAKTLPRNTPPQPRVLLVAPLSGHFSTLLRETARTLLQDHDVYITDWHNARDVHLRHGAFGLDDYVEYLIRFLEVMGPGAHVVAVCQPCVAALAATAIMAEDEHAAQPRSLTLMAGPVDCRVNPSGVNTLATSRPIEWFEKNLICHVPLPHAGFMRRVYPGFVQLSAFLSMNLERHKKSFRDMYRHLVDGEVDKAEMIRVFYEEYLAVNDLPAEFYLETVRKVFQTYDLPRGKLSYKGRIVNPAAIRRTALLTVEGERDDICSVGQTVAAQDLCTGIRPYMKSHHVQVGVGHYGVFSGRKWAQQIYPRVRDVIHSAE
ncbi:MAG: polyhydroxyalkanoate depolymerase [Burkholderiaceae bacterium]|nr:polyhydroxyalkanoate depolymerase [Burkholderiaceae bacterium]MDO9088798.1 polyhydroxyalkanoate depolymerase [Burkholderiaceae bacterium]